MDIYSDMRTFLSRAGSLIVGIIVAFAMLVSGFIGGDVAQAAEIPNNIVTSASVTGKMNSNGSTAQLTMDFQLPNNTIKAGDTSTITLPSGFTFNSDYSFDVKASDGSVVAHALMDSKTGKLVLTYTDYAEKHSDVTGKITATIRADIQKNTDYSTKPFILVVGEHTVNAGDVTYEKWTGDNPKEIITKWGWAQRVDDNTLSYTIRLNGAGENMTDVTVSDSLASAGLTYNKDSFKIHRGKLVINQSGGFTMPDAKDVTKQYTVSFTNNDTAFSVKLGDIGTDGVYIQYTVNINHTPVNNEAFKNTVSLQYGGKSTTTDYTNTTRWQSASGEANGYNYAIHLVKTNENNDPLSGAVFKVVRDRSGETVGMMTTNAAGEASISGLLRDDYTITETQAPDGYDIADPVHVTADQMNNNAKTAEVKVVDKLSPTSVSVTKKWDDQDNQDGLRPSSVQVQLYANGKASGDPVTLNADNNWAYEWTGLAKSANGKDIAYTVKEVNTAEGYKATVSGDAASGYMITNTHTPETTTISGAKTWKDQDDQDGVRPASVKVNLLADGSVVKTATVSADTNWAYSFTDLPVYKSGSKITYTVTEDHVDGYTTSIDGYNITNTRTPDTTGVTVTKKWDDQNNADKLRPSSIQVQLYADGKASGDPITLNADNSWTYTFTDLAAKSKGKVITYTVKEISTVAGYTSSVNDEDMGNVIITNTHTPAKPTPKSTLAKTGSDIGLIAGSALVMAIIAGAMLLVRRRLR